MLVKSYVLRPTLRSENRLIEVLSPGKGATPARRRAMRIRKAIIRRVSHQYGSRENVSRIVSQAVDELKSAGCQDAEIAAILLEVTRDVLAAIGGERRSLVTGQSDWQAIAGEIREIIDGRLDQSDARPCG